MKVMNVVLSALIALSAVKGFAAEEAQAPLTAKQVLAQQYAELEDLKAQVKKVRNTRTGGTIGIVVSTVAVGAGAFISLSEAFGGIVINTASLAAGEKPMKMSNITPGSVLFFGGAAGIVGSTTLIIVETRNLHKLEAQIDKLEGKIKDANTQLN